MDCNEQYEHLCEHLEVERLSCDVMNLTVVSDLIPTVERLCWYYKKEATTYLINPYRSQPGEFGHLLREKPGLQEVKSCSAARTP